MDVVEILKLVVGPAVVSTAVTLSVSYLKEKRNGELDLAQSAWEVCRTLERYSLACSRMIEDVNESLAMVAARQAEYASDSGGLPPFAYPASINWKAFEGLDSYRIRGMETAYDATKRYVSKKLDDNEEFLPDRLEHQCVEAAKLGQVAWKIAGQVREKHGLPPAKLHPHDSHALEVFTKEIADFQAREKKRIEYSEALHRKLREQMAS